MIGIGDEETVVYLGAGIEDWVLGVVIICFGTCSSIGSFDADDAS